MLYECTAVPVDTDDITVMATSVPIAESYNSLTPREIECLRELVGGKHTASIAKNMGVKSTTINTYKQRIKEKLGIDTLAGLIAWGCKHFTSLLLGVASTLLAELKGCRPPLHPCTPG